ncbi:MAG: SufB/SufD family protein [Acidimicrobiales bacterium]
MTWAVHRQVDAEPANHEEDPDLPTFTADGAAVLPGPEWFRRRRTDAFDEFAAMPLPSAKEDVWRYSPIEALDLDAYGPAGPGPDGGTPAGLDALVAGLAPHGAVTTCDGVRGTTGPGAVPDGVTVNGVDGPPALGSVLDGGDALVRLHDAFVRDAVVIDVAPGVSVDRPVVIVHWCSGAAGGRGEPAPAVFPRTVVRAGRGAQVSVVEVVAGAPGDLRALVVPVTELEADDGAQLAYVGLQVLGTGAWHIGRLAGRVGTDAALRSFTLGLGGSYARLRTDAAAAGPRARCELRSAYVGSGEQVHDIRTLQDHLAPHSTSDLLCKGAVAGAARSVYSGLIRVRRGAVRSEAMQTNHNLVLDEGAHADSVPNLDIEENDVRCTHASTVGPVDEDQLYYLESRGVSPARAERLIVLGFFRDIVARSPVASVVGALEDEVGTRLDGITPGDRGPDG